MAANDSTAINSSHVAPHVAPVVVPTAYKKLVVMLAHMFYNGQCPPAWWVDATEPKKQMSQAEAELAMFQEKKASQLAREAKRKAQQDTTGLGIVLLTALAERQWVEEEDLAKNLNLPPKMVRKAMRFFEQEQLVQREHRKETKRGRRKEREMLLAGGLMQAAGEEEEEEVSKGHVITYCSLDFPRLYDTVRWRLEMVKKNLEREAKNKTGDMHYKCPNPACGKVFQQMDVFNLMPSGSRGFGALGAGGGVSQQLTCDICTTEIEMLMDDEGTTMGTMQDKRERQRKAKAMLEQLDNVMQPLQNQLRACEASPPPDFTSYTSWLTAAVDLQKRLTFINNNENAVASRVGPSQRRPEITQDTKVTVCIAGSEAAAPGHGGLTALAGAAAGVAMLAGAAAGGAGGRGLDGMPRAGGAAGPATSRPLPPWLQSKVQSHPPSQATSKPFPPFLLSAHKQQQQPEALLTEQVRAEAKDFGYGDFAIKQDSDGVKAEMKGELKLDADGVAEDWQPVATGAAAAAATGVDDGAAAAGADDIDEEDWEDVV